MICISLFLAFVLTCITIYFLLNRHAIELPVEKKIVIPIPGVDEDSAINNQNEETYESDEFFRVE